MSFYENLCDDVYDIMTEKEGFLNEVVIPQIKDDLYQYFHIQTEEELTKIDEKQLRTFLRQRNYLINTNDKICSDFLDFYGYHYKGSREWLQINYEDDIDSNNWQSVLITDVLEYVDVSRLIENIAYELTDN